MARNGRAVAVRVSRRLFAARDPATEAGHRCGYRPVAGIVMDARLRPRDAGTAMTDRAAEAACLPRRPPACTGAGWATFPRHHYQKIALSSHASAARWAATGPFRPRCRSVASGPGCLLAHASRPAPSNHDDRTRSPIVREPAHERQLTAVGSDLKTGRYPTATSTRKRLCRWFLRRRPIAPSR